MPMLNKVLCLYLLFHSLPHVVLVRPYLVRIRMYVSVCVVKRFTRKNIQFPSLIILIIRSIFHEYYNFVSPGKARRHTVCKHNTRKNRSNISRKNGVLEKGAQQQTKKISFVFWCGGGGDILWVSQGNQLLYTISTWNSTWNYESCENILLCEGVKSKQHEETVHVR